jgi:hypothetical protein
MPSFLANDGVTRIPNPYTGIGVAGQWRSWLDVNKVNWNPTDPKTNWKKLNKGKGYGINGPRTKAAWAKFMGEYNKSKTA